jgi:hypothetical protein
MLRGCRPWNTYQVRVVLILNATFYEFGVYSVYLISSIVDEVILVKTNFLHIEGHFISGLWQTNPYTGSLEAGV